MTDDLDNVLREWGRSKVAAAPDCTVPDLGPARRRWVPALAAAAVVIVVAGAVALVHRSGGDRPQPQSTVVLTATPPPPGTRESVFHGLAIDVPAAWADNALQCGTPIANTVAVPQGSTAGCLQLRPAGVTDVTWLRFGGRSDPPPVASARTTSVEVGGRAASRSEARSGSLVVVRVVVPSLGAGVEITSPSAELAAHLVSTLHVTPVDQQGCAARSDLRQLADLGRPTRSGTDERLVPGDPLSVTVCRYVDGYVEQSGTAASAALTRALRTVNGLPQGLSRSNPRSYLAGLCDPKSDRYEGRVVETFVLHVRYPSGAPLILVARLGFCGTLGITNGARTGQTNFQLLNLLNGLAGITVQASGDLVPITR